MNEHLDHNKDDTLVDQKVYRSITGSFLYVCASRPVIIPSICMFLRFQEAPKECHLATFKTVVRYLLHTPNFGLWYPKGSPFDIVGYTGLDYACDKLDRKTTSGRHQFLGRSLIS